MIFHFENPAVREHMYHGRFGLERETLRVDARGALAQTPHPFGEDERISRDFCENQVEIITPPAGSAHEAVGILGDIHRQAVGMLRSLDTGTEYLWPFSNPPRISGEKEIPVARFHGSLSDKTTYRQYLAGKYGKKKMLFCGIHCNYSFDEAMLEAAFADSGASSFRAFKDAVYLTLAQRLAAHAWLLVYLTAASPVSDASLWDGNADGSAYASARCGEYGYWNDFVPVFDYTDMDAYTDSIWQYIRDGAIVSPSELYYPIRLKPKGENRLDHLRTEGVSHIELRMLDVNPLRPEGIFEEDISFISLLILYLMSAEYDGLDEDAQRTAVENFKNAARYDEANTVIRFAGTNRKIKEAAADILHDMRAFYVSLDAPRAVTDVLAFQENKLLDGRNRYAFRIRELFAGSFTVQGLALAKAYAAE